MPIAKVQLIGGGFQDSEGQVLANGYLKMKLNQDSVVNSSQICSGVEITINLDASGNVVAAPAQSVWGNDQLSPANSFYRVTGYKANGQPAWGPNNQQVTGNGGTFDVGTWTPNSVISWTPPLQPLLLQTNEVDNGDQLILDLHAGTNISLVDNGSGRVTITNTQVVPTRVSAIWYVIDGGGFVLTTGAKGQLQIPVACTVTGWVLTADQGGAAVVDVLRSTYANFPTTASIAGSDKPTLVATSQKNENLGPLSGWGSTALLAGDELQFNIISAATVTRLNLTLIVTIP